MDAVCRIVITDQMRARATRVGRIRQHFHDERGTPDAFGATGGVAYHITGALGELSAATIFGVEDRWIELAEDYKGLPGDIAPGVQIRSTDHPRGRLLLHPYPPDRDEDVFGSVRILGDVAEIQGWIRGVDGKRSEWWSELQPGRPCFVVPNRALTRFIIRKRDR